MATNEVSQLKLLLNPDEVITPTSSSFTSESIPWAIQKDQKPSLVVRPASLESLSKVLAFLSTSKLDFAVRSQGFGSASAKDVIISLTAFDAFELDLDQSVLTLGAGQSWGDYYEKMEKAAPGHTIVACRTPSIGVGGSTLCGGFSWLSGEYGCVSDPANMLDAQVVKLDGSIKWASEEPELLWALRGTVTGFAVVTAFKFRVRPYTQNIWAGPILLPNTKEMLQEIAQGIISMNDGPTEPKVAMFLYLMRKEIIQAMGGKDDMIVVHVYDALGESHGREAFAWALKMPGALDVTSTKNLRAVSEMQRQIGDFKGTATSHWSPIIIPSITSATIVKSFEWYDKATASNAAIKDNVYLLFELFCCRDSLTPRTSSGWPRPQGFKHMVLLGAGVPSTATAEDDKVARQLVAGGAKDIFGESGKFDICPNSLEDYHCVEDVFAENYAKLQRLKFEYDPGNKLKGPIVGVRG